MLLLLPQCMQQQNRNNSNVAKFIPSGWTNGRLPDQKVTFEFENTEYDFEYKQKRDQKFLFSNNKEAFIYSSDEDGIDMIFDGKRHYSE